MTNVSHQELTRQINEVTPIIVAQQRQ